VASLLEREAAPGLAADTLDQIRVWARSTLDIEHVPAFWRVLARHPPMRRDPALQRR
jgi:hypothetical protein